MSLTISLTFVKDQPKKVYGLTNPKGPKLILTKVNISQCHHCLVG